MITNPDQTMQLGVFSDVHDNLAALRRLLALFSERGVQTLLFCGDFCSPIPVREMGAFDGEIHCVFGNGDGDRYTMQHIAQTHSTNVILHGEYADLSFDGARVAVTHYPFYARALARTGDYQAVFSGHTHVQHEERLGACLWLNPGEVMGWKGPPTCALYDTATTTAEIITL